jgi:dolichol-phosphate mannosyltransferase
LKAGLRRGASPCITALSASERVAADFMAQTESPHSPVYSVVVPVLNEAGNVGPLVEEIVAAMSALPGAPAYEIIFVDDGSDDATPQELSAAVSAGQPLAIIRHAVPVGQSQALISGIERAAGDWIVTLDGDGQNDPADIAKLIGARDKAVAAEPGLAKDFLYVGHRLRRHDSLAKRYQSWLANDIRGWLLGDHTPDGGCGLKLFRRSMFLKVPRFDAMHRFLPALFIRAGGRAISVQVNHRPRTRGVSKYGFWRRFGLGIVDLIGVAWLIARYTPPRTAKEKDPT